MYVCFDLMRRSRGERRRLKDAAARDEAGNGCVRVFLTKTIMHLIDDWPRGNDMVSVGVVWVIVGWLEGEWVVFAVEVR